MTGSIKHPAVLLFAFVITLPAFSQKKEEKLYKEIADAFRKEVWGWNKPAFSKRAIPAEFTKYSKVILARHLEIKVGAKRGNLIVTEIFRESVKINDMVAVKSYSEITFNQMEEGSGFKEGRTTSTYLGIKLIKPDGSIREIDADKVAITTNDKNKREAKIAIPNLQPGDILDYFVAKEGIESQGFMELVSAYVFEFYEEVPVFHYSIHSETEKRYAIEYRYYNGSPVFTETMGPDNRNILDLTASNLPVYTENGLWISPYRQLPIIRMNIIVGYKGPHAKRYNARNPGEIYKNTDPEEFIYDEMFQVGIMKKTQTIGYGKADPPDEIKGYFKEVMRNRSKISPDSFAAELFYMNRYREFIHASTDEYGSMIAHRPWKHHNSKEVKFKIFDFMNDNEGDVNLTLTSRKDNSFATEIMGNNEIDYLVRVKSEMPSFFGMSNIFSPAFHIPYYLEGEKKAQWLDMKGDKNMNPKDFDKFPIDQLPASTATDNTRSDQITVEIADDKSNLSVRRLTTIKGHSVKDIQMALVTFEEYNTSERKAFGLKGTLLDQLDAGGKKAKMLADELRPEFIKYRKLQKDMFRDETNKWLGIQIENQSEQTVKNIGARHTNPNFVYSSKFSIPGLIKKAGDNMIVETGRLFGGSIQLESEQRKRKLDVLLPFPESVSTEISFTIPANYKVEGLEALNKTVQNSCGQFTCEARLSGQVFTIKTNRTLLHSFEPANNWESLLAIIDAENEHRNSKILLKRN